MIYGTFPTTWYWTHFIKTEENEIFVLHFFLVLGLLTSLKADKMSNYLVI